MHNKKKRRVAKLKQKRNNFYIFFAVAETKKRKTIKKERKNVLFNSKKIFLGIKNAVKKSHVKHLLSSFFTPEI
jgi:transcriptional regulator NrdR family protein